jgi:hypothetical protein
VDEMAALYGFSDQQKAQIYELLSPEYTDLWAQQSRQYMHNRENPHKHRLLCLNKK